MTSVPSLTTPERNGQFILTTDQLAQAFNVTPKIISNNFNRHKDVFVEEIHYFFLERETLFAFLSERNTNFVIPPERTTNLEGGDSQSFTSEDEDSQRNANKIRNLYLWTLKGAFKHAWLLRSPQAEQAYEKMVDRATQQSSRSLQENALLRNQVQTYRNMLEANTRMPGLSEEGLEHIESFGVNEALTRLRKAFFRMEKKEEILKEYIPSAHKDLQELRQAVLDVCSRSVDADTELVMVSRNLLRQQDLLTQLHTDLEGKQQLERIMPLLIPEQTK